MYMFNAKFSEIIHTIVRAWGTQSCDVTHCNDEMLVTQLHHVLRKLELSVQKAARHCRVVRVDREVRSVTSESDNTQRDKQSSQNHAHTKTSAHMQVEWVL